MNRILTNLDKRHARRWVLYAATFALVLKLILAITTFGTNDIGHWDDFMFGVRTSGPVGIYGLTFLHSFYNHPPLIGYFLEMVNWLNLAGLRANFTIRAVVSAGDFISAMLMFEVLARRFSIKKAMFAGVLVACSPVLYLVSGFHGNTDPLFAMLVLASFYLLVDRRWPYLAGVALALAVSIKVVPVVVVPAFLVFAWRRDRREFLRFSAAAALAVTIIWLPALIGFRQQVFDNVLGYAGIGRSKWGVAELATWFGRTAWFQAYAGGGHLVVVAACAIVPALLVFRRPDRLAAAIAVALGGFLVLSPAFGVQYLVWPVLALYLVDTWLATMYNVAAGILLVEIYNRWSGGLPWYHAVSTELSLGEGKAAFVVWLILLAAVVRAIAIMLPSPGRNPGSTTTPEPPELASTPAATTVPDVRPSHTPRETPIDEHRGRPGQDQSPTA